MNTSSKVVLSVVVCLIAFWLLQKPKCNRGCKTIAEHLLTDGLDELLAALFA